MRPRRRIGGGIFLAQSLRLASHASNCFFFAIVRRSLAVRFAPCVCGSRVALFGGVGRCQFICIGVASSRSPTCFEPVLSSSVKNNMNAQQKTSGSSVRIAIPVAGGRLNDHFGACSHFAIVDADLENKRVLSSRPVAAPPHAPGLFPSWLREQGVQTVIVGGIGRRALELFAQAQIEVRPGRSGASIEELVNEFMAGTLTGSPNACTSQGHHSDHTHCEGGHSHHSPAS